MIDSKVALQIHYEELKRGIAERQVELLNVVARLAALDSRFKIGQLVTNRRYWSMNCSHYKIVRVKGSEDDPTRISYYGRKILQNGACGIALINLWDFEPDPLVDAKEFLGGESV